MPARHMASLEQSGADLTCLCKQASVFLIICRLLHYVFSYELFQGRIKSGDVTLVVVVKIDPLHLTYRLCAIHRQHQFAVGVRRGSLPVRLEQCHVDALGQTLVEDCIHMAVHGDLTAKERLVDEDII